MRGEEGRVFDVYWPVGVAVFVAIAALVVYVVVRFRSSEPGLPRGRSERTPAELGFAAIVAGIVAALLIVTYTAMSDMSAAGRARPAVTIEVTAAKWNWRFAYPGGRVQAGGASRPATLVVPADTPVRFRQTSVDVIHSFWIPAVRFKRDAFPDRVTTFTLTFPDVGFLREGGQCAQFCGLLHSEMAFDVRVLSRDDFRAWLGRDA